MSHNAKRIVKLAVSCGLAAVLVTAIGVGNGVAIYWNDALEGALGTLGPDSFTSAYVSDYESDEALIAEQQTFVLQTCQEGAVLLKNENGALPLIQGAKVSVFGHGSVEWVTGGKGSGSVASDESLSVKKSLESAGFTVNKTLWDFTAKAASKSEHKRGTGTGAGAGNEAGDWRIGEIPQTEYTQDVKNSYQEYSDAAVIVFGRVGGEGSDLPRNMGLPDNDKGVSGEYDENSHYLELDNYEKDLLKAVKDAGVFKHIIVIVNSANPLELGEIDKSEYGVDGCLWLAGTGNNGINAIGTILNGDTNPSGRLVDTFAYDEFSSPAMQNMGDYRYVNSSGELQNYSYMVYAEGIYVGYRYYETRYADKVTGRDNVGNYDYSATVQYPFGYGLSYTEFEWSGFEISEADVNGDITVKVTVKNNGSKTGKEIVEIYAQSPFIDYDVENSVEKSAVELVGFAKTAEIASGESETVEIIVNLQQLASYDAVKAGTYLLEAGDYYLTAGRDAHAALNNILSAQSSEYALVASPAEKTAGNAELTGVVHVQSDTKYDKAVTGTTIKNLFDYADMTNEASYAYDPDFSYLSRTNWKMMDNDGLRYSTGKISNVDNAYVSDDTNKSVYTHEASDRLLTKLAAESWENSGNTKTDADYGAVTTDAPKKLSLSEMSGKDYDDPLWDELIDQMSLKNLHLLFRKAGYCTQEISAVDKPKEYDYDGPAGISNYLSGKSTFGYQSEIVLAATWNKELALKQGKLIGEDGIKSGTTGWYAPAMNTHRTPFSGRNYEYYSEDGLLAGTLGALTVQGAQSKGMYCDMKHFAANDQETNRSAINSAAIWSNEQALREIYFLPFRMAVEDGDCHGCMTTMNRIGDLQNFGNYHLITELLRGEWGFNGVVITDYTSVTKNFADQILAAGGDLILNTGGCPLNDSTLNSVRGQNELRRAAHNVLYTVANSNAIGEGARASFPVYVLILIIIDIVVVAGVGVWMFFAVRSFLKHKNERQTEEVLNEKI